MGVRKGKGCIPPPQIRNLKKNIHFVDLRDLSFSRKQPLKYAEECHIKILKNKLIKSKKEENRKIRQCDYVTEHVIFLCR